MIEGYKEGGGDNGIGEYVFCNCHTNEVYQPMVCDA